MKKVPACTLFLVIVTLFSSFNAGCQVLATFTVDAAAATVAIPVYIDLDNITQQNDSVLVLKEVSKNGAPEVACQVEQNYHRFLWWMLTPQPVSSKRTFTLSIEKNRKPEQHPLQVEDDSALVIKAYDKNVLQYNYRTHYPPADVDSAFKRSGFIHPLWSPAGNVLTQINPKDHYHHVGIWNPWTHVLYKGKEVDFWNLGDKKGTVRFAGFINKDAGAVYAGFKALQNHVAFNIPQQGDESIAMNEVWDVRVYNTGEHVWLVDFTSTLNNAADDTITLEEYRYGGFGFRAAPDWNNKNSKVLTSEGKTRKDADASTARWCTVDGDMQSGHSGIEFMSYPSNYNFPEPMRVWPENMNGRGDVFFSFSPTRNKSRVLMPGKNNVLKYRMLVYDGTITAKEAETIWKAFAQPPAISIQKINK